MWKVAECIAELVELGDTQREIAAELGCSKDTVRRCLAVWNLVSDGAKERPPFSELAAGLRADESNRLANSPRVCAPRSHKAVSSGNRAKPPFAELMVRPHHFQVR